MRFDGHGNKTSGRMKIRNAGYGKKRKSKAEIRA